MILRGEELLRRTNWILDTVVLEDDESLLVGQLGGQVAKIAPPCECHVCHEPESESNPLIIGKCWRCFDLEDANHGAGT